MLLSVKQAAERLSVSVASVYAMCAAKEIGHHRGKRIGIKISEDQIAEYLNTTRQERGATERQTRRHPRPSSRLKL